MSNPTFKAIERRVSFALCLVAAVVTVGLTFSTSATAKSMTDAEYKFLENNIETEFNAAKARCNLVSGTAFDKCIADAESIRNASKLELNAQRKIIVAARTESKPNAAKLDGHRNIKPSTTNAMPVMDELTPAFKKTRLI